MQALGTGFAVFSREGKREIFREAQFLAHLRYKKACLPQNIGLHNYY